MWEVYKMDLEELKKQIEALRKEMNEMGKNRSYTDSELVKKSQELDKLLNKYYEIKKNTKS